MKESTLAIHGGIDGDETTGAVNVPIYQTSTYRQRALGETTGWEYSRTGNPTRAALEKLVADLEGGSHGFAFGSGMAAIAAVLSLFRSGDRILLSKNVYGGTFRILDKVFNSFGLTYSLEDTDDIAALEKAVTPDVKALLVETPANPLLAVTNLKAVAALAKRHGILLVVDNTFMTPYLQKPLVLGADIVVHSATKYLGGHSDLVAGLVGVLGPFDSFLLIRGIKTLAVRMDRHVANAETLARRLQAHPDVSHVWYPSLDGFPGRDIQLSQAKNGGAMISFELAAGRDHRRFFSALKLVTLAESLGGVESLVCHPASMTHASIPKETREKIGITDRLIRLSVGIEDVDDIWVDIQRAITEA